MKRLCTPHAAGRLLARARRHARVKEWQVGLVERSAAARRVKGGGAGRKCRCELGRVPWTRVTLGGRSPPQSQIGGLPSAPPTTIPSQPSLPQATPSLPPLTRSSSLPLFLLLPLANSLPSRFFRQATPLPFPFTTDHAARDARPPRSRPLGPAARANLDPSSRPCPGLVVVNGQRQRAPGQPAPPGPWRRLVAAQGQEHDRVRDARDEGPPPDGQRAVVCRRRRRRQRRRPERRASPPLAPAGALAPIAPSGRVARRAAAARPWRASRLPSSRPDRRQPRLFLYPQADLRPPSPLRQAANGLESTPGLDSDVGDTPSTGASARLAPSLPITPATPLLRYVPRGKHQAGRLQPQQTTTTPSKPQHVRHHTSPLHRTQLGQSATVFDPPVEVIEVDNDDDDDDERDTAVDDASYGVRHLRLSTAAGQSTPSDVVNTTDVADRADLTGKGPSTLWAQSTAHTPLLLTLSRPLALSTTSRIGRPQDARPPGRQRPAKVLHAPARVVGGQAPPARPARHGRPDRPTRCDLAGPPRALAHGRREPGLGPPAPAAVGDARVGHRWQDRAGTDDVVDRRPAAGERRR